jgi:hypothetical protein
MMAAISANHAGTGTQQTLVEHVDYSVTVVDKQPSATQNPLEALHSAIDVTLSRSPDAAAIGRVA